MTSSLNCLDESLRMLYSCSMRKDKARDIARGVLPSTARKGARDNKRIFHTRHRSAQNQANHAIERSLATATEDGKIAHDVGLYDDFEGREVFDGYTTTTKVRCGWDDDIGSIVDNRRGHDKLGPLISWARATEKDKMVGWSVEDKVAYFKAVLPDTLQGRHALGHVKSALDLYTDPFLYGFRSYRNRPEPITEDKFRASLARHLSSTKGRAALRSHILDVVPVAAHTSETNNKVRTTEPAVDENGNRRYFPATSTDPVTGRITRWVTPRPMMVDVYVPQIVAVTCDDCAFLRNDPLATTAAINRFVDIVWDGRSMPFYVRRSRILPDHAFLREIFNYVYEGK